MTSPSTSGRQQIARTRSFWVVFVSQFLDNGSTDSGQEKPTNCRTKAADVQGNFQLILKILIQGLVCNLLDIFAP